MEATYLLIDDDPDMHYLFEAALQEASPGSAFVPELLAKQALIRLQNPDATQPDLIFLDLNMPGMDGRQCLTRLKAIPHLSLVPVVIFSTSDSYDHIEETYRLGSNGYVVKPDKFEQLVEAILLATKKARPGSFFIYRS